MRLYGGFFLLTVVILFSACRDEIGEALFEMDYPPKSFTLPAGTNTFVSSVVAISNIPTNYPNFLNASGYSNMDVTKIVPRYARLVSLDGLDTGFLTEVSVRICPNNQQDCTVADEAFYIDNIYRRNISNINLQPGLGNFKDLLSSGLYRLEVVFFLGEIAPYSVDFRLEYGFQAFK
jgi:hypothetical protein